MMNHKIKKLMLAMLSAALLFTACNNDDDVPPPVNEEELITTATLSFTNSADPTDVVTASYYDEDGDGPTAPVVEGIILSDSATYIVTVEFLNETETPAEDVTEEVEEEDEEHQVFFEISDNLNLEHVYTDEDDNGDPVGLVNAFTSGAASAGTLRLFLIHEPNKGAAGVADGNRANAGGATDVNTEPPFPVTIVE